MYMVLYQQLAKFIPRRLLRKCRRRRRLTMAYILYVESEQRTSGGKDPAASDLDMFFRTIY